MKQEIRLSPVASDHAQMAEPSVVQHGVVEVLTFKECKKSSFRNVKFSVFVFSKKKKDKHSLQQQVAEEVLHKILAKLECHCAVK